MVNYILHYFDCYGRAEPTRMMLNLSEIPFIDRRFAFDEWPSIKQGILDILDSSNYYKVSLSSQSIDYLNVNLKLI